MWPALSQMGLKNDQWQDKWAVCLCDGLSHDKGVSSERMLFDPCNFEIILNKQLDYIFLC